MKLMEDLIINDPSVSDWLKQALVDSHKISNSHAVNEAEILLALLKQRKQSTSHCNN